MSLKYGRKPAQHDRPHLKLAHILRPDLPAAPASADWVSAVPGSAWGMLGNDELGDCTCAGVGHKRIGDCYVNQGVTLDVSTADAIKFYENFGYIPGDPNTDQGAVCQDVLEFWQKYGFKGERILAFAKVDIRNEEEVKQAISLFGQVYTGFDVPESAMKQFQNGETWDVIQGDSLDGGHCVTLGAYDSDGLTAVTWGKLQKLTWDFFRTYFDEAWVIVTPDFFKDGYDYAGVSLANLERYFTALTGRHVGV